MAEVREGLTPHRVSSGSVTAGELLSGAERMIWPLEVHPSPGVVFTNRPPNDLEWAASTKLRIKDFGTWADNWDSYGAPGVSFRAIQRAVELVDRLAKMDWRPVVGPTSEGGIEFEWAKGRYRVAIEVLESGDLQIFYYLPDDDEWLGSPADSPRDLSEVFTVLWRIK